MIELPETKLLGIGRGNSSNSFSKQQKVEQFENQLLQREEMDMSKSLKK